MCLLCLARRGFLAIVGCVVQVWNHTSDSGNALQSPPAVTADGTVVMAFSSTVRAFDGVSGAQKWSNGAVGMFTHAPALDGDGRTVFVVNKLGGNEGTSPPFAALDAATGTTKWSLSSAYNLALSSPAVDVALGLVYFVWEVPSDTAQGSLTALNTATGTIAWMFNASSTFPPVIGSDSTLYYATDQGVLYALSGQTGAVKWQTDIGKGAVTSAGALSSNGVLMFGSNNDYLVAVNASTSEFLWRYYVGSAVRSGRLASLC